MNYRHAYHAGNHGDCLKHAVLVWLLHALRRKPAPFTVLDLYAGAGCTDLAGPEATRTGEWQDGFGKLLEAPPKVLAPYVALAVEPGAYPGSPMLSRALLRPQDRLVCCELHPDDHAALRRLFANDTQVAVHRRDAREAVRALLPPATARGLVLLDPPYEAADEFSFVAEAIATARRRFATGILCAWYPIKHRAPVRDFFHALRTAGLRDLVAAELWLRPPADPARLNGSGVVVAHPPHLFAEEIAPVIEALCDRLGEADAGCQVLRLADE